MTRLASTRPTTVGADVVPSPRRSASRALTGILGWIGVAACAFYGGFGLYAAGTELLSLVGLVETPSGRAAPPLFVLHALSGSIALIGGALQLRLASRLLNSRPRVHRAIGWTYVLATWVTCAGGLATVAFFDVGWAAKAVFAVWSISWSAATAVALGRARCHRYGEHRRWMLRSFALALVFMTFDIFRSAVAATGLPRTMVYALGLLLAATAGLAIAEAWIRRVHHPVNRLVLAASWRVSRTTPGPAPRPRRG
jgi:hypothetical protein